jgi:xanthine dehydrogenase YagR molybdenum-binding subunit
MDQIAEDLKIDPLKFRMANKVGPEGQPGARSSAPDTIVDPQPLEAGIPFSSYGLTDCLTIGSTLIDWENRQRFKESAFPEHLRGTGLAMCLYRGGPGGQSTIVVRLHPEYLEILTGILDVGQGIHTVLVQLAAEIFECDPELVIVNAGNSSSTPESPLTAGSTATFSTGLALANGSSPLRRYFQI